MPLETRIIRNGEPLRIPWGGFHVAAMVLAVTLETGKGPFQDNSRDALLTEECGGLPIAITPSLTFELMSYPAIGATALNDGPYTVQEEWTFQDVTDGEILQLLPGDVLHAYRAW